MRKNKIIQTTYFPKGTVALFFIQIFATLSFSVLFSTLMLYTTKGLKMSDATSVGVVASLLAFNYVLHLIGGYIGGRWLSHRVLFLIGMIAQITGCIILSIPTTNALFWGLAAFLTGCGLNVININCMLTQLFQPDDKRRETAFLWNYSGMNIGFLVGSSISGYFQLHHTYHALFLLASLGDLMALIILLLKWNLLCHVRDSFVTLRVSEKLFLMIRGLITLIILVLALRWLLEHTHFSHDLILFVGVAMAVAIAFFATKQPHLDSRNKIFAYLILAFAALIFWVLYQLAPMGLTLFIERNVDRHYLGILIAPQWVQGINTIVIILGAPILSALFNSLRARGFQITIPLQFSLALIIIGISFLVLTIGIHFSDVHGLININWIFISYILQSSGELLISPIGYAMVGELAPVHLQGVMMGTWLMIIGVASTLSGSFTIMALGNSHSTNQLITNPSFSHTFSLLGWSAISAGILLAIFIPALLRLTHEKKLFAKQPTISPVEL